MKNNKMVLVPANEVQFTQVKYDFQQVQAPRLAGLLLKLFTILIEAPLIGSLITGYLKKQNKMNEMLRNTVIPEPPMFKPEYPPQEQEAGVVDLEEEGKPEDRVESALRCLPHHDPAGRWNSKSTSFRYWKIRDYAYAYRSGLTTPAMVAKNVISAVEECKNMVPQMPLLISFDVEEVRKQAAASTQRFEEGRPLSILDGIFMAVKDDIDCYPHPSTGGTTWLHNVRPVNKDGVAVSRLRSCGVIFVGKTNMHELGLGATGMNPHHGTPRNPHDPQRYTGGSSSGSAAIVASGICPAALGSDAGGSIRIPASLCGIVGLKTTYGRTDMKGTLCSPGTVEVIGPIASSVDDVLLVYAAMLGSSPADKISLRPPIPCLPNLSSGADSVDSLPLRLGKYTEWFNDVHSPDISDTCGKVLTSLSEIHGCEIVDITIPEIQQMFMAQVVSYGSESLCSLVPQCQNGEYKKLALDSRIPLALFQSLSASDYVAAQRFRRRSMYYHMEIFKKVDVIVTPATGMTAPTIHPSALSCGESDLEVTGAFYSSTNCASLMSNLMKFAVTANVLGFPAISVPVGYDKQGLPIGLQLIGRPWGEATILRLAAAIEQQWQEPKKKPIIYFDILKAD
ncbi:glutamyl-tRNA(Gln) amidotransferase subunit A [Artemisia annua]|uniref:Glutamyl-tRNA(Gln) amidotransferase subunit A n=1 Tax=Artemisia annua TaxID=35608 RepID=A0A2U1NMD5_ARTAN|nr:glutamyl-tRNA(Gln) amidotransferase subunit A [Artemisia annua]